MKLDSKGVALKVALLGAGVAAGAIVASAFGASAATTTAGTGSASTGTAAVNAAPSGHGPLGGPAPVRSDEHSLSAALTAKLKAEALKAVPGATVNRIETDAGDATYEAHMTKADGSLVTVKFDKSGNVLRVEQGMGRGDPRPRH